MAALLADQDVYYAAFVEAMSIDLVGSELGLLNSCTCEDWCHVLDFRQESFNPDIVRAGTWEEGNGWKFTDFDAGGIPHSWHRLIDIEWDTGNALLPNSLVTSKIEAFCTYQPGTFAGGDCNTLAAFRVGRNDFFSGFIKYPSTRPACGPPVMINGQDRKTVVEGTFQFWHTGSPQLSSMRVRGLSSQATSAVFSGTIVLHKIILYGTGSKPTFGSGEDC
jgi:hypothetical protein